MHVAIKPHDQRRNERARENVTGQHGEDHRLGQRDKQIAGHSRQEKHRHEDNADAKRRNKGRQRDFLRAVENGLLERFPRRHVPMNVFDRHGGIIDQNTDRQSQAAEGHEIDGFAQRAQNRQRTQDGKRNGKRDDDRAAPGAEKEQNHHGGERGRDNAFLDHVIDRRAHEQRLIGKFLDLQLRRQTAQNARHRRFHPAHHIQRRGRPALQNRQQRAPHAVLAHDILLRLIAVAHLGDVAHVNGRAVHRLDRQDRSVRSRTRRAGVELDVKFGRADLGGAAREDQVLRVNGVDDVLGGQVFGLERRQIEIDGHDAGLAAVRPGHGGALNGRQSPREPGFG